MIQRVMAGKRRLNVDAQAVLDRLLTDVLPQGMRAQCRLHRAVFGLKVARHQSLFHFYPHIPAIARSASRISSSTGASLSSTCDRASRASMAEYPQRRQRLDGFGEIIRRRA